MKKVLLFTFMCVLFSAFVSCRPETEKDRVENVFKDYMENEYSDPREFDKIVSIEPFDTINANEILQLYNSMSSYEYMMLKSDVKKLNYYKSLLEKDTTNIITYKVNVILKSYDNKYPTTFFVVKNGNQYKVQNHEISMEEIPGVLSESLNFVQEALFRTQAKQILGF